MDPALVLHARLPLLQPLGNQLLQDALVHPDHLLPRTRPCPSLCKRLPNLHGLHLLLDNAHLPPLQPPLQLLQPRHRPIRPDRHPRHEFRPTLLPLRD